MPRRAPEPAGRQAQLRRIDDGRPQDSSNHEREKYPLRHIGKGNAYSANRETYATEKLTDRRNNTLIIVHNSSLVRVNYRC